MLTTKWVLRLKAHVDQSSLLQTKFKARFDSRGSQQIHGISFK